METNTSVYPLRLTGELSQRLSRGLWLVKWLLAIPHFVAALMTDAYPPFRLDMGGDEPPNAGDAVPPTPAPVSA